MRRIKQLENTVKELDDEIKYLRKTLNSLSEYIEDKENNKCKAHLYVQYNYIIEETKPILKVSYYYRGIKNEANIMILPKEYNVIKGKDVPKILKEHFTIKENNNYISIYDRDTKDFYLVNKFSGLSEISTYKVIFKLFEGEN